VIGVTKPAACGNWASGS